MIWTDFVQPHRPREVNPAPASCKSKQMHQGACHPVITPLLFSTFRTALTAGHASRCRLNKHTLLDHKTSQRAWLLPIFYQCCSRRCGCRAVLDSCGRGTKTSSRSQQHGHAAVSKITKNHCECPVLAEGLPPL